MQISRMNKILIGSSLVIIPLSFYGGLYIKEFFLAEELGNVSASRPPPRERAIRARIVQLEQERKELLREGNTLDEKIAEIKKRISGA